MKFSNFLIYSITLIQICNLKIYCIYKNQPRNLRLFVKNFNFMFFFQFMINIMNLIRNQHTIILLNYYENYDREHQRRERIFHKISNYPIRSLDYASPVLPNDKKNPKKTHPHKIFNGDLINFEKSGSPTIPMIYLSSQKNNLTKLHDPTNMAKTRPRISTHFPKKTSDLHFNICIHVNGNNPNSKQNSNQRNSSIFIFIQSKMNNNLSHSKHQNLSNICLCLLKHPSFQNQTI